MSEAGIQIGVARVRAGASAAPSAGPSRVRSIPSIDEAAVRRALEEVMDPELPVISVVDLGMVHRVDVGSGGIDVAILPTFVGCPALDVIRGAIADRLAGFGVPVHVAATFEIPWTSDRITSRGRAALAAAGIAPPGPTDAVECPICASPDVVRDSLFGPTQCRSLYYCRTCRQPFEALKTV